MNLKKLLISASIIPVLLFPSSTEAFSEQLYHTVNQGESIYSISKNYNLSFTDILNQNNLTKTSVIFPGQKILINKQTYHKVVAGDSYWKISQQYNINLSSLLKLNNASSSSILNINDIVILSEGTQISTAQTTPNISYSYYTVKSGDTLWHISDKFGIPLQELLNTNKLSSNSILSIGTSIKIPIHNIPIKSTSDSKHGEYLDWWTEARYVMSNQSVFEVEDYYTGKRFTAKRTTGTNHADVETLTTSDTNIMKEIWGGSFSWTRRPVIILLNGRRLAASASAMPHAGNDNVAGGVYTTWRSLDYGPGYNLDWIKNNGMHGHIDIHFLNSTRHMDGKIDASHQANIKISAGIK